MKVTKKALKTVTSQIYEKINGPFKKTFGVTFVKAQTNVPKLGLQDKKSHAEMKKERRKKSHSHKLRGLLYSSLSFSIFISHVEFQRKLLLHNKEFRRSLRVVSLNHRAVEM